LKQFKCVLFDCDGVLIDSEVLWNRVEAEIKTEMGFPITLEEQYRKYVGMSHDSEEIKAVRALLPPNYKTEFKKRYGEVVLKELKRIEGMGVLAQNLRVPFGVVSNSTDEELKVALGHVGYLPIFENVLYSSFIVGKPKPDPTIYLYAAEKLGVKPRDCLVIEDSPVGTRAGCAAGMMVWGFTAATHFFDHPRERLIEAGASDVFDTVEGLSQALKKALLLRE